MKLAVILLPLVAVLVVGRVVGAWQDVQDSRAPGCAGAVRFDAHITRVSGQDDPSSPHLRVTVAVNGAAPVCLQKARKLRLSWPAGDAPPHVGELWRVRSKIRSPWGMANPGTFDYANWLLANGIHGTGFVTQGQRLRPAENGLLHIARNAITDAFEPYSHTGPLKALALGEGEALSADTWEQLRRSGTVHLFVVSGLHISVAVTAGYLVTSALVRLVPVLLLYISAHACSVCGGLLCAFFYTALSGFAVPSTRAFIMAVFVGIATLVRRRVSTWLLLGGALAAVLALFPLSIFASGFWLSFGAVAALLLAFAQKRTAAQTLQSVTELLRVQWLLGACLTAYTAFWVGAVASVGLVANLLFVPFVTLILVPLLLTALIFLPLSATISGALITCADAGVGLLLRLLAVISEAPLYLVGQRAALAWAGTIAAGVLWLTPLRWRERWVAALIVLLVTAPVPPRLPHGEFRVTVLDVGQGSAAIIETRRHTLLMDAGPRFPSGFDTGRGVVLPFVAGLPHRRVDTIIASHLDVDHAGGIPSVLKAHPDSVLYSPDAVSYASSLNCLTATAFTRDGVDFRLLTNSAIAAAQSDNDRSCTLHVANESRSVLIMGDTGARFETLLARQAASPIDVLVVPHHGSASSSSKAFVRRTNARHAMISAGRSNRYNHPSADVVRRYLDSGARVWTTSQHGALTWRSDRPDDVTAWRLD